MFRFWVLALLLLTTSLYSAPLFKENDGLIIIEAESAPVCSRWVAETDLEGFTGSTYYTWRGGNLFNAPGQGILAYRILINKPGKYNLFIRNRHEHPDHTLENDVFTRMDKGKWIKTYSSIRGEWTWHSHHEYSHSDKRQAEFTLEAGEHMFYISARSANFSIDRIHLAHVSVNQQRREDSSAAPTLAVQIGTEPYKRLAKYAQKAAALEQPGNLLKAMRGKANARNEEEAAEADRLLKALANYYNEEMKQIQSILSNDPAAAVNKAEKLYMLFKGDTISNQARDFVKTQRSNPDIQDELKADKAWQSVIKLQKKLQPVNGKHNPADENYRRKNKNVISGIKQTCRIIAQKFPGTKAAQKAEELLDTFGD